jgi:hypothetical protein
VSLMTDDGPPPIHVIDRHHLQVDDKVWWGEFYASDYEDEQASIHTRQFVVRFESGWSASIIWGNATYSDNHDHSIIPDGKEFVESPQTVELAIFHKDREGIQPDKAPMAYLDADDVNLVLHFMRKAGTTDSLIVKGRIVLFLRAQADLPSEQ